MPVAADKPAAAQPIGYAGSTPVRIDPIWYRALDVFLGGDASTLNGQPGSYYRALSNATGNLPQAQVAWSVVPVTGSVLASVGQYIDADASGGALVVTLPAAAGNTGKLVGVCKADSSGNTVTISAADNINGSATLVLSVQYTSIVMISTGTEWRIL